MLKLFLSLSTLAPFRLPKLQDPDDGWVRDPLAHPAIAAMDERQRADLPFGGFPSTRLSATGPNATGSDAAGTGCGR